MVGSSSPTTVLYVHSENLGGPNLTTSLETHLYMLLTLSWQPWIGGQTELETNRNRQFGKRPSVMPPNVQRQHSHLAFAFGQLDPGTLGARVLERSPQLSGCCSSARWSLESY